MVSESMSYSNVILPVTSSLSSFLLEIDGVSAPKKLDTFDSKMSSVHLNPEINLNTSLKLYVVCPKMDVDSLVGKASVTKPNSAT